MAGDHSSYSFRPTNDFVGVFEQQGRVRLDANLNELVDLIDRRLRATALDTLGPAVVPAETPDAFRLKITPGALSFGAGRAYVDGIQVDNHGIGIPAPTLHFDPHLEELRGTDRLPYSSQPYLPVPPALPTSGTHLVYLDVWHRERTWAEDPTLLDPALYGIDTAVRRQVVWQVKVHEADTPGLQCDTPDGQIPGWADIIRPSASRLTTAAVGVPAALDPCDVPPLGGYRGRSNRLYCVEIHDPGPVGVATFKWSRDNASLASPVTAIAGADISVVRPGRDALLRFTIGDVIEVTDDVHELDGLKGEMAVVANVDDARGVVTLAAPLGGVFDVTRGARIRRWDQSGGLVTAAHVMQLTAGPIVLEDGVQIEFTLDPDIAGGVFRSNERWAFRARVADASVEVLDHVPPRAPHHHVARLGFVDFTNNAVLSDCRVPWPGSGDYDCQDCACDVCVTAISHNSGALTIQAAVDKVRDRGGVVCLQPGVYVLRETVDMSRTNAVRLRGKGWTTIVLTPGPLPAFFVDRAREVTIEEMTVLGNDGRFMDRQEPGNQEEPGRPAAPVVATPVATGGLLAGLGGNVAIAVRNTIGFVVQRCSLIVQPTRARLPALTLLGIIAGLRVRDCQILGATAIGNAPLAASAPRAERAFVADQRTPGRLLLAHSRIEDNVLVGLRAGIAFVGTSIHLGDNVVADNIVAAVIAGITHLGTSPAGPTVVRSNIVAAGFYGIIGGLNPVRIADNEIIGLNTRLNRLGIPDPRVPDEPDDPLRPNPCAPKSVVYKAGPIGIVTDVGAMRGGLGLPAAVLVTDGLGFGGRIESVRIGGNEVEEFLGFGIMVQAAVATTMIHGNRISRVSLDGIVVTAIRGGAVSVHNNVIRGVGYEAREQRHAPATDPRVLAAIAIGPAREADVRANQVLGVRSIVAQTVAGVWIEGANNSQVALNTVNDVSAPEGLSFGIAVRAPFDRTDISENRVRQESPRSRYTGVSIGGLVTLRPTGREADYHLVGLKFGRLIIVTDVGTWWYGDDRIVHLQVGRELGAVHGNTVDGTGLRPMVQIIVGGNALLNDNRIVFVPDERGAAVRIGADSAVVSANYVETRPDASAVAIDADPAKVAISTNVTNGDLRINGAPLAPPWDAMNIATP
ncbi:DUF6519 domain-containing protein [Mycolicibacterium bacteremicum]|uniref:Right handed beta helix domain-containing protein n=1 Tax=Mycolicibacterium bacteremicum TaxID=564198 RepID=A0A1W9Z4K9_MYCBA|nr:DUF6519 domain-containing protein [Mycolicibacterium bacteremicum]ORA07255.1 hypothetical protein BST17_01980 [Mycolicibacterium bacteremicum]